MIGLGLGISKAGSVSEVFYPTSVSNLELWLKNGESIAVEEWQDQSGNSNHATQEEAGNQATIANGGFDFRADNEHFYELTSEIAVVQRGSVNVFAVVYFDSNASNRTIVGTGTSADFMELQSKNTIRFHFDNTGAAEKIQFGTDYFADGETVVIHSERISGTTGTLNTQINGTSVHGTNTAGDGADPGAFAIDRIGTRNGDRFMNGKILELIIYTADATDMANADIVSVNNYLMTKFSL
jgi:hypothetical protein